MVKYTWDSCAKVVNCLKEMSFKVKVLSQITPADVFQVPYARKSEEVPWFIAVICSKPESWEEKVLSREDWWEPK